MREAYYPNRMSLRVLLFLFFAFALPHASLAAEPPNILYAQDTLFELQRKKVKITKQDFPVLTPDQTVRKISFCELELDRDSFQIIQQLVDLEMIALTDTNLGDDQLSRILSVCDCTHLSIVETEVTSASLERIAAESSLKMLTVDYNVFDSSAIDRLERLRPDLEILYYPTEYVWVRRGKAAVKDSEATENQ